MKTIPLVALVAITCASLILVSDETILAQGQRRDPNARNYDPGGVGLVHPDPGGGRDTMRPMRGREGTPDACYMRCVGSGTPGDVCYRRCYGQ